MATVTEVFARTDFSEVPNTVFYEVDAGAQAAVVTNILIVNTAASTETFTLLFDGVEVFSDTEITGKSTISIDMKQALPPSAEITGSSSNDAIKLHMSGVVIS
jgi:hypothetical protein